MIVTGHRVISEAILSYVDDMVLRMAGRVDVLGCQLAGRSAASMVALSTIWKSEVVEILCLKLNTQSSLVGEVVDARPRLLAE